MTLRRIFWFLAWFIVSFCPTFTTLISPFILVLLLTATSLPSNGKLDALDVDTAEDLPTDRDDWLCRRNQLRQPNVRHGIMKNGNGTGEIIVMEPPAISMILSVNIIMTGRGSIFDGGLILAKLGVARALNSHFLMSVSPRWLLL